MFTLKYLTRIIVLLCTVLIATSAHSQTNWRPYGNFFADISVDEQFAWGLTSTGDIKRIPIEGAFSRDLSKSPWTTIPGGLKDISASGSGWVWGVNNAGNLYKCAKPCSGKWSGVTNWPGGSDIPVKVFGDSTHIWAIAKSDKIYKNAINGAGKWEPLPGSLIDISTLRTDAIWGVHSGGGVWTCKKPCDPIAGETWQHVKDLPAMTAKKVYAAKDRIWVIDGKDNAWRKDDGGEWLKRADNVKNIASVNTIAWQVASDGRAKQASLNEVVRSNPEPYVLTCREGWIKANDACAREVFFHAEEGLTLQAARVKANSLGGSLSATGHLEQAWKNLGLDKWAYGRLSDGSFAVPVQKDYPNFKRGVNFNAKGGNQGFFYIKGCQDDRNPFVKGQYCDYGFDKNLASPLSEKDLNTVMVWIGERTSESTVDYCYKNSTSRPGYPWQSGDQPFNWNPAKLRCEAEHGKGACERQALVTYPVCEGGMSGAGPICWQNCPNNRVVEQTGQNIKVDCVSACAINNDVCALALSDKILAPINMITSIITLGLDNAAKKAALESAEAALGGAAGTIDVALDGAKWAKLSKALERAEEIFGQVTDAQDKIQYLLDNVENLEAEIERWNGEYEDNFRDLTSWQVDNMINRQFNEQDRSYIKQKYAQYQLTTMLTQDAWRIAGTVTTAVGFEPTGIVSVIEAFAHPVCVPGPVPFPNVRILPENERVARDPLVFK